MDGSENVYIPKSVATMCFSEDTMLPQIVSVFFYNKELSCETKTPQAQSMITSTTKGTVLKSKIKKVPIMVWQ